MVAPKAAPIPSLSPPEPFETNLYSNPGARVTQDAVVAALPPPKRLETLLSVTKAGEVEGCLSQMLQTWEEAHISPSTAVWDPNLPQPE